MSDDVVTIVFEKDVNSQPFVTMNGIPIDGALILDVKTDTIEDVDAEIANGFTWACEMPGVTTWELRKDGEVIFAATEKPLRIESSKFVGYVWGAK